MPASRCLTKDSSSGPVIVAARLAQNAKAGELLVTEVVRGLLPRSLTLPMAERTDLALKGIEQPPRIYAVDWHVAPASKGDRAAAPEAAIAAAQPSSHQVLCPVVIGRDREGSTLDELLTGAIEGRGRTVLVSGDAGLGKSALIRGFVERVRARGARVLVGECTEIEARRPFGPLIDAFVSADLQLPPELAQGGPGALPVAEVERYRVHAAFADRISTAAKDRPVVLVIEDLHWGDDATFELIPYLARKLRDEPVLLLATYRSDELHRLHPLNHVLAEITRGRLAEEVRLKKLTLEQTGEVIRAALGLSRSPTPAFRQALFERTEGNPFFLEEILRALVETGELEYREGSWHRTKEVADLTIPASVRDAVQQRLAALEPNARKAMQVAAVIGQRFDFELLQLISGLDDAELFDAIKAAIDAQLVREETTPDGTESYMFRHALSREAVLAELLQRERRMLHRAVGEAIERLVGTRPERRSEELAYHFDEARDVPKAQRYHKLACERSLLMAAPRPAMQHLERAIELAADDDAELVTSLLRLADIATSIADNARALRAAEQAKSIAEERGDVLAAGDAIHRISLYTWFLGEPAKAETIVAEGIARLEPLGPSGPLAACYVERSRLAMIDARPADTIHWGQLGLQMARDTGAIESEVLALNFVGTAMSMLPERATEGIELLEKSVALAEQRGLPYAVQRCLNNLLSALSRTDAPYARARAIHDRSVAHAREHGVRIEPLITREVLYSFIDGDWDRALEIAEEARNETIWSVGRDAFRANILVAREGPDGGGLQLADEAARLQLAGDAQSRAGAAAAAIPYFLAERYRDSIMRAQPQLDLLRERAGNVTAFLPSVAPALRSAWLIRDDALAGAWIDVLTEQTGRTSTGMAAQARGAAHRIAGRQAEAAVEFATTLAAMVERGLSTHASIARQDLIEMLMEIGRRDEAVTIAAELLPFWRKAKATWYVGRLEAWLAERDLPVMP